MTVRIAVISDTHGLLRPEATAALRGADLILHAGDIGSPEILAALRRVAPTRAVCGNNDRGAWAKRLPERLAVRLEGTRILVVHDRKSLDVERARAGFDVVVSGHSHQPCIERIDGIVYVNPGSAGPRRFRLPVSLARMTIAGDRVRVRLVTLPIEASGREPRTARYGL